MIRIDKRNIYLLIILSLILFGYLLYHIRAIEYVGAADSAAYGELADSIIQGKGFSQEFVGFFYKRYPRVTHPMGQWLSLYGLLIIPFFLILGKTALAVKLPGLISFLILPSVVYLLGKKIFSERVAFFSALSILIHPMLIRASVTGYPHLLLLLFVVLTLLFLFKGFQNQRYFYLAGLFLGLGFLIKVYMILLLPVIFIFLLLYDRGVLKKRPFWLGVLVAFLIMSPWEGRNLVVFKGPMLLDRSRGLDFAGFNPVVSPFVAFFGIHYDESPLTKLFNEVGIKGILSMYATTFKGAIFCREYGSKIFILEESDARGGIILMLSPCLALFCLVGFLANLKNRKAHIIWLLTLSYVLSLCLFLPGFKYRHLFFILPLLFMLSWEGFFKVTGFLGLRRDIIPISLGLALLLYLFLFYTLPVLSYFSNKDSPYPYRDTEYEKERIEVCEYLKEHTPPQAVIMGFSCWDTHFYSDRETVMVPYGDIPEVLKVAKFYKVGYLITHLPGQFRGFLPHTQEDRVIRGLQGFEPLSQPRWEFHRIYRINYDALPFSEGRNK